MILPPVSHESLGAEPPRPLPGHWLPDDWEHPLLVPVGARHHLRPLRSADAHLHLQAVFGSRERLRAIYGPVWNWPLPNLDRDHEVAALARYESETEAHESFTYALFDSHETALLGHVYIDPPMKGGADADISWWVVDDLAGGAVEARMEAFVTAWVAADWPLSRPRYPGRDLTWDAWLRLPEILT